MTSYLERLSVMDMATNAIFRSGSSVFMFHRVLPRGQDCYEQGMVTPKDAFADILDWLIERFRVVSLEDLVARKDKPLDKKRPACAITFDDGWVDNFVHAFPMLRERKLPATIFLPVNFIGTKRRFWQERMSLCIQTLQPLEYRHSLIARAARDFPWFPLAPYTLEPDRGLRRFLLTRPSEEAEEFVNHLLELAGFSATFSDRVFLNWDEIFTMQGEGISFGSHTLNHVRLPNSPPARAKIEICESRRELQERLGVKISAFSYPWGAWSRLTRDAVIQSGYGYAVATRPGLFKESDDWLLPRIDSNLILQSGTKFNPIRATLSCGKNILFTKSLPQADQKPLAHPKRIGVVFVIDAIADWEGGTERQLHAIIRALDRNYFEPELWFIFKAKGLPEDTMPCPARWLYPNDEKVESLPRRIFRLRQLLREKQPEIVHTFFIEGIFTGILAARMARIRHIVGSTRNAGHWKKRRHRIAFRTVARLAHHWQCNSRSLWEYTRKIERVSPKIIDILPNAIDLSLFKPVTPEARLAVRKSLGLNPNGPVFVYVASLTGIKDHATLLAAVKILQPTLPSIQIVIVGEGPLETDLKLQRDNLGLEGSVHFFGGQADVRPYLAAADFGVLTSHSEGSSNAVLEYMAMGLPSVVSDILPNRELLTGLFFTPGDASGLARGLMIISQDAKLCDDLRFAYLQTASQFSRERLTVRIQSYYNRLFMCQ